MAKENTLQSLGLEYLYYSTNAYNLLNQTASNVNVYGKNGSHLITLSLSTIIHSLVWVYYRIWPRQRWLADVARPYSRTIYYLSILLTLVLLHVSIQADKHHDLETSEPITTTTGDFFQFA
jgi:hypothetical protein